eukprot:scaffold55448_cov17-Tisochrysis_lutea.AAC.3
MAPWLPSGCKQFSMGRRVGWWRRKGKNWLCKPGPAACKRRGSLTARENFLYSYQRAQRESYPLLVSQGLLLTWLVSAVATDRDVPHPNGRPPKVRGGALWVGGFLAARASRGLRIRRKTT